MTHRDANHRGIIQQLLPLVVGFSLGLLGLYTLFAGQKTDFERFNLGPGAESYNPFNAEYQCEDLRDADDCLDASRRRNLPRRALWLGNSQLNTIAFYQHGDVTAVHKAHDRLLAKGIDVFGINAYSENLVEQFILYSYAVSRIRIDDLILPIVFPLSDQTTVRPSIAAGLLDDKVVALLQGNPLGRHILTNHAPHNSTENKINTHKQAEAAASTAALYEPFESRLNAVLNNSFELFRLRSEARGQWTVFLLRLRNFIFYKITADPRLETVGAANRSAPPLPQFILNRPGYERNHQLLSQFIDFARAHGTRVHLYWAPVPQQLFLRTDVAVYAAAKSNTHALAQDGRASFYDFESIVPDDQWNIITRGDDWAVLDIYHFRQTGHDSLANGVVKMFASDTPDQAQR